MLGLLAVLLLLLALVLFTPACVRVSFDQGDLAARVQFGPVKVQIFPAVEKEKKPKKEKKSKKKKEEKQEQPKDKKRKINADQILYSVEKLPPVLGRALRRIGRRLHFQPLKIHLLVAGYDPADTAELYGKLQAALAVGLPVLHRITHIRDQDIQLFLDFQETEIDCIADVGISLRLWDVLSAAVCAGGSLFKWYRGFKKLADPAGSQPQKAVVPEEEKAAG